MQVMGMSNQAVSTERLCQRIVLIEVSIWQSNVNQPMIALRMRGKSTTGKKQQLLERVLECIKNSVPISQHAVSWEMMGFAFLDPEHDWPTQQQYIISPSTLTRKIAQKSRAIKFVKFSFDQKHGSLLFHLGRNLHLFISLWVCRNSMPTKWWGFFKKNFKTEAFKFCNNVMHCKDCQVNLCIHFYSIFHTVKDL